MGVGESRNERFYHFCGLGKAHLVEKMLEADRIHKTININWQLFESKCTPLLIAAANGHDKVVEILLQNGADVKATDERFCTALHHAAQRGHSKIIEMLLKSGCDVNAQDKNNWSPLMNACYWAHRDAVVHLLRAGANPSLVNSDGRNVLLELCRSPSRNEEALAEIAHVLIETGTSVDIKASAKFHSFKEDFTALMYAAYHNHARIASVLIESNCNLNIQDYVINAQRIYFYPIF